MSTDNEILPEDRFWGVQDIFRRGRDPVMYDLCVDLVGPYTLKGKDGSSIDFMALTVIDPASSWFEVVELLTITRVMTKNI